MKRIRLAIILSLLFSTAMAQAENRITLEDFLVQVRDQNLGLKVELAKSRASNAKSVGLALPPPMLGFIRMTEEWGSSASGFEVSQTIPFPTKLSADHSAREYESRSQEETRLGLANEILAKARLLYFLLWAAQEKKDLLNEKKSILEQHIKLSRAGARSDGFLKIHTLKAESDLDLIENDILTAEQIVREKQIQMAESVNADPVEFYPIATEPPLSPMPRASSLEASHQLEASRLTLESLRSRESEAKSSWFPDLNIRYKEMNASSMYPSYSEVMVGISLPFAYFWEPRAESRVASAGRLSAELEYSQSKRKIEAERASLFVKAEALKKQLDTLSSRILPRAEKRWQLVRNLAPRDMGTLQDHRETMEAFPDLKMKALDLRQQYEEAVSELTKYSTERESP